VALLAAPGAAAALRSTARPSIRCSICRSSPCSPAGCSGSATPRSTCSTKAAATGRCGCAAGALRREQRRLLRLQVSAERARATGDRQRYLEACSDIARFPLAPDGERYAAMPTRLGNLTYEYELYPNCKYGLDSVFFFYRIWVSIDKDLRDELDRKQASVDGAFYLSFVLALAALWFFGWFWILLAADSYGESAQVLSPWLLGKRIEFAWALPTWVNSPLSGIYLVLPYGVYRLSLYGHAQYGEFFKALFDQHRSRLQHQDLLDYLAQATGDSSLGAADFKQANRAIWRYLRWHKMRLPGQDENRNLEAILATREAADAPAEAHIQSQLQRTVR
jgi:hypothetical protein